MNRGIIAIIIQEGSKFIAEVVRNRPFKMKESEQPGWHFISESQGDSNKATGIATGCVPCSIGHLGTCVGVLNEAMRFARSDGIDSEEVIDRVNICADELNGLERVDLRPEMIANLPEWEKELANKALNASRSARHGLEGMKTLDDLERVAAETQSVRQEIGRQWFKQRLSIMPKEEKAELAKKAMEKLQEG